MARCPFAKWVPLPEQARQPAVKIVGAIDHSIVGSAASALNYFRTGTSLESHFIIDLDGTIYQLVDTARSADANRRANRFIRGGKAVGYASIETADRGDPDNQEWTSAQVDALVRLHVWLQKTHGFVAQKCKTTTGDGFGYHTLFGAPSDWTPVAKTCPGRARIAQWNETVLPRTLEAIKAPSGPTPTGGFLMALSSDAQKKVASDVAFSALKVAHAVNLLDPPDDEKGPIPDRIIESLSRIEKVLKNMDSRLKRVEKALPPEGE
jgi:hypothetical protein